MKLPTQDAELFFKLMFSLQAFVNRHLNLIPGLTTPEEIQKINVNQRLPLRDAIYDNIGLLDKYVQGNPEKFSSEELTIVQKWHGFIRGDFYVERHLAKHTIFIKGNKVYAVLGLYDPLEELVPRYYLPTPIKTALLPFKGQIIYDGLVQGYNVMIGSNMRASFKEIYLKAKQNNRIITTLESETKRSIQKPQFSKDWSQEIDALVKVAQKLKAESEAPPIQKPAFNLVRASLELAQLATQNSNAPNKLWAEAKKVERALGKVFTTLERSLPDED